MAADQDKLPGLSDQFQKLQAELQSNLEVRQKLDSQQQENKGVKKEFAKLADGANIFKLVGPALLKQDRNEAVMAVDGRLDYIEKEINKVELKIKELQQNMEATRSEIFRLQTTSQQQQATQVAA